MKSIASVFHLFLTVWIGLAASLFCVSAQESGDFTTRYRIGGGVFGSVFFHSAAFTQLPGVATCCPNYENGSGLGLTGAIFFQKPLAPFLSLSLWGGAADIRARFASVEEKTVTIDNTLQTAAIEHILETNILSLYFETQLSAQFSVLFSGFIGLRGDFFAKSQYQQREELLRPESGSFETGSRVRNETSGSIPGVNRGLLSPVMGVRFDLPLNSAKTLFLFPELSFAFSINNAAGFTPWSVQNLRLGAAFGWQFDKETEVRD